MDWHETQWWLNATKNESSKWRNTSSRNRTKVYIYPSYGHFDEIDLLKTTVRSITSNSNDESNAILPGITVDIKFEDCLWSLRSETDVIQIENENSIFSFDLLFLYLYLFPSFISGPEDINDFKDGLYQWSVTLTARMWPPIESGSPKHFLGLPLIVWWGILSGCLIVLLILFILSFFFCWLLPRRRQKKLYLSQNSAVTRDSTGLSSANSTGVICMLKVFFFFFENQKNRWLLFYYGCQSNKFLPLMSSIKNTCLITILLCNQ